MPIMLIHCANLFITHCAPYDPCPYCKLVYKPHLLVVPGTSGNGSHFSMVNSGKKAKTRGHYAGVFWLTNKAKSNLIFY